jgi:S1-C subfamily serine protease
MLRPAFWAVLTAWLAGFWALGLAGRGLRRERGSRPAAATEVPALWDDPPPARPVRAEEAERLARVASALGRAVLEVGHPRGDSGSAFVISKRHRLLATNAHVAAIFDECGGMVALGDGMTYRVERVWYHPDYLTSKALGSVLGDYPRGGPGRVVSRDVSPDVAVLQLAPGGPDLPAEWPLAGPDELRALTGRAVGKLGFPGRNARRRPDRSRTAAAVTGFGIGTVSRVCPFAPCWDVSRRWHVVDASAPARAGDSGGPVFLPDGHVIAVSTWNRSTAGKASGPRGRPIGLAAVRIDALRELLRAYRLDALVPDGGDPETARIEAAHRSRSPR